MLTLLAAFTPSFAQSTNSTFGVGLGLPYGAIGFKFEYTIADQFGMFLGLGYNLVGLGYNAGVSYSFKTDGRANPYLMGMFGTNASSKIVGAPEYDKSYVGPSFGAGVKVHSYKKNGNYWDFGLVVPVRNSDYKNTIDAIKNDPRIEDFTKAFPVLLVIGYNVAF